ncbi:MAG: T9SS type A sorting domain-containing protein [Ignavibacteriaceae bacterium]
MGGGLGATSLGIIMFRIFSILYFLIIFNIITFSQNHWQSFNTTLPDSASVLAIADYNGNIIIGLNRSIGYTYYIPGGVYISSDDGETWRDISIRLPDIPPISCLLVYGDTIFAGTPGIGIYKTTNTGLTWHEANNGILKGGCTVNSFLSFENLIFVSTNSCIYKSNDCGLHWIPVINGLPASSDTTTYMVKTITNIGSKIYAGLDAASQGNGGLFVSTDFGDNWQKVVQNWNYNGTQISTDVESLEYFDGSLYMFFNGFWLVRSTDEGETWSEDADFSAWTLYTDESNLFSSSPDYLFFKVSQSLDWEDITYNLPGEIWSILKIDSLIYIGTRYNGIWRSSIQSLTTELKDFEHINIPTELNVDQNFPNPFNSTTTITYSLSHTCFVIIKVYDVLGNEVKTLVNEEKPPNFYKINFNADDLSSGIYFYQMKAGKYKHTIKMILLK